MHMGHFRHWYRMWVGEEGEDVARLDKARQGRDQIGGGGVVVRR